MREIKFRAWDKTRNMYGQVLKLERPYAETDMGFCGHAGRLSLFNIKNEIDCGFWGIWIEKADLEQFTGLRDKNGLKDIYEGDIISPEGEVIANIHEGKERSGIDLAITAMGCKSWRNTEQEAIKRGCFYAQ